MGHPMDGYYDGLRAERESLWQRRDAVLERVNMLSLAEFGAHQFPDLTLLYDRKAPSEKRNELIEALTRLEAWLDDKGFR